MVARGGGGVLQGQSIQQVTSCMPQQSTGPQPAKASPEWLPTTAHSKWLLIYHPHLFHNPSSHNINVCPLSDIFCRADLVGAC
jgi:hypothetical protein